MSVNKYTDHVLVLPEDRANEQILNGFITDINVKTRAIQVLPYAGGWLKTLDKFKTELIRDLNTYPKSHIVLVIDFDNDYDNRIAQFNNACPVPLKNRFYVLGTLSEPERLKSALNTNFESIGQMLVSDCTSHSTTCWSHELLQHNLGELARLQQSVSPFLFKT